MRGIICFCRSLSTIIFLLKRIFLVIQKPYKFVGFLLFHGLRPMTPIAFFDLDYTLLDTSSGLLYLREIVRQRRAPLWFVGATGLAYQFKLTDFGETHARLITRVGDKGCQEAIEFFEGWVRRLLLPRLTTAGRAKIDWHKQQGHRVV